MYYANRIDFAGNAVGDISYTRFIVVSGHIELNACHQQRNFPEGCRSIVKIIKIGMERSNRTCWLAYGREY